MDYLLCGEFGLLQLSFIILNKYNNFVSIYTLDY